VIVADIRGDVGRALVSELGNAASFQRLDVTDERAWHALADELRAAPVNVLVNNAGAVISFAPLHEVSPDEWRRILDLNLTSAFLGMRYIIPLMVESGGGSVINLSSISGVVGHAVAPAYQAAKGGI